MKFIPCGLGEACVVTLDLLEDERGFNARTFCTDEFVAQGLNSAVTQINIAYNRRKGTMRGMHYQIPPAVETKFIRCTRGAIYDVIVDVRPGSPTFGRHHGIELTETNRRAVYVPAMFAHGCLSLTDDAEVTYHVSEVHTPGCERGFRYDDPAFGITLPIEVETLSVKDAGWAPFATTVPPLPDT